MDQENCSLVGGGEKNRDVKLRVNEARLGMGGGVRVASQRPQSEAPGQPPRRHVEKGKRVPPPPSHPPPPSGVTALGAKSVGDSSPGTGTSLNRSTTAAFRPAGSMVASTNPVRKNLSETWFYKILQMKGEKDFRDYFSIWGGHAFPGINNHPQTQKKPTFWGL